MRKTGDKVIIYDDIVSKTGCQGVAELVKKIYSGEPCEFWWVRFIASGEIQRRLVMKPWRDMTKHWIDCLGLNSFYNEDRKNAISEEKANC